MKTTKEGGGSGIRILGSKDDAKSCFTPKLFSVPLRLIQRSKRLGDCHKLSVYTPALQYCSKIN